MMGQFLSFFFLLFLMFQFLFPTEKFQPEIFNQISMLWEQNAFVVPKHFYEEVHPEKKTFMPYTL